MHFEKVAHCTLAVDKVILQLQRQHIALFHVELEQWAILWNIATAVAAAIPIPIAIPVAIAIAIAVAIADAVGAGAGTGAAASTHLGETE